MKYKLLRFSLLSMLVMLCGNVFADQVTMKYSGSTTGNMTGENDAALLGLDAAAWSVVGDKGANSNMPGLNKAGDIRLYWAADGSNTIKVESLAGATINSISMTFTGDNYSNVAVTVDDKAITAANGTWAINNSSFVLGNANTSNVQVRISELVIDYTLSGGQTDTRATTTLTLAEGYATTGEVGGRIELPRFTVTDANGSVLENATVTWESSNTEVATINATENIISLIAAGTATIKATYAGDETNYKPSTASFTITVNPQTVTITSLYELQNQVTATSTPANITFRDVQVVYVNGNNAYFADANGYGALLYTKNHGLEAGQVLNGTIAAKIVLYQGNAEITDFTKEGLTITEAEVTPTVTTINAITKAQQSTLVTLNNVTASVSEDGKTITLADGDKTITFYDKFKTKVTIENGKTYDITGVIVLYNETIEICPRTADDVAVAVTEPVEPTLPITATWDFTDADIVAAAVALSGSTEAGTIESNGLALTVEANGQTIRDNGNSIQTGNPVIFKVPVQGKKDVVTVVGYPGYFAYSIAGVDATEATTEYTATAADVAQGYVEIVSKGLYIISISVTQNEDDTPAEPTFPITATWDFTDADIVAAAVALSGSTEAGTIESNGLALTVEANGQTIRDNGNSIQTGNPVIFKVPVQGKKDVVTVVGYPGYFAYSIAGVDATEATTEYTATAADVAQGYVEIVSKGLYIISISVTQNEDDTPDTPVAQDVTGTWSYANTDIMAATIALSGSSEAGEVEAAEKNGLKMIVEANGASFRNNGDNIQVRSGAVFKIPVKNAGDLITVVGYPGYSYYTIAGGAELNDENTYKAKISDAEAGYVAVKSTNDNNYFKSLSVVQYAPKEKITLDNEAATVTFAFNEGTEGQKATFSNVEYFLSSKVTVGSNWSIQDKTTYADATETRLTPTDQHNTDLTDDDAVSFVFTPKPGFAFTPTKVGFKTNRFGTDNGLIDAYWLNADGTTVELEKEIKPERNNSGVNTVKSYDIAGATVGEGACGLKLYLYKLQAGKQIGLADIVIEGVLNGTEKDVPVLASFKVNGNEYAAEDVFGELYEATLKLSKKEAMVGSNNPLTDVTAKTGEVGTITYEEKDNACTVTIPMTAGDTKMDYVLNVVFKPDYKLEYIGVDGSVLATQAVEEDATIDAFAYDINEAAATKDGYKARGWFKTAVLGEKFTTADVITANTKLYAIQTEIEEASTHKKYFFDLANKFFYAEDHEAFNPSGDGFYWHDAQHGWAFKNGNTVDLLVGPKATITVTLCQYGSGTGIAVKKAGETLATLDGIAEGDGGTAVFNYEGEAGTLTLEMQCGGEMYIHAMKIVNTAEVNFESQGNWYFVKAGDAGSLLDVLDVVNGVNAKKDAARSFIFLPDGTYDLDATVKTAITGHNISLIGQSMDKTIIVTKPDKSIEGLGKADLFDISGTNLYMQDLTLQNALDYYAAGSAGRAAVIQDAGNRTIGKNVRMLSYQDTYYSSNSSQQAYWENCDIHGTVDFICGGGDVRFQNTTISLEPRKSDGSGGRTIVAPTTNTQFGYVFDGCTVVDLANGRGDWNFGRTWQNEPICVYLNTTLDNNAKNTLVSSRWTQKGMNNKDPKLFGEYGTKDVAGNDITPASNKITSFGGTFETILTADQAAGFAYDKMFTDWDPATLAKQLEAPAATLNKDKTVTWTPANDGAIAYALFKNGEFVALTEGSTFENIEIAEGDVLTIRTANTCGGFGLEAEVKTIATGISNQKVDVSADNAIYTLQGVRVDKAHKGLYIINGRKVVIK